MPPAASLWMPVWQPLAAVQFSKTSRPGVDPDPEGAVEADAAVFCDHETLDAVVALVHDEDPALRVDRHPERVAHATGGVAIDPSLAAAGNGAVLEDGGSGVHSHTERAVEGDRRTRHPGRTQHTGQHQHDRTQRTASRYGPSTARKPAANAHIHLYSDRGDGETLAAPEARSQAGEASGAPQPADQATELVGVDPLSWLRRWRHALDVPTRAALAAEPEQQEGKHAQHQRRPAEQEKGQAGRRLARERESQHPPATCPHDETRWAEHHDHDHSGQGGAQRRAMVRLRRAASLPRTLYAWLPPRARRLGEWPR